MKICVCIKQVPDMNKARFDSKKGVIIRNSAEAVINPDDYRALEAALQLKRKVPDCMVTVITMGPAQAEIALRECLALGADEAVMLSDRAFAGADSFATAKVLSTALAGAGYDLILTGRRSVDGCTAQVGAEIAAMLNLPVVSCVRSVDLTDLGRLTVERIAEERIETLSVSLPCVLTVDRGANIPGTMNAWDIFRRAASELKIMTHTDLGISKKDCGDAGSPTKVGRSYAPPGSGKGSILSGNMNEMVARLIEELPPELFKGERA